MTRTTDDLAWRLRANYSFTGFGTLAANQTTQVLFGTNVYAGSSYAYSGFEHVTTPRTRVAIDPNVRVRGNGTYVGFEDVEGPIAVGEDVEVYESESNLAGHGRITEIDTDRELVYLSVDWLSLREVPPAQNGTNSATLQFVYVPSSSALHVGVESDWMRLAATPCLASMTWSESAFSITAPALRANVDLLSCYVGPRVEFWRTGSGLRMAA